jgi:hypothetical protein
MSLCLIIVDLSIPLSHSFLIRGLGLGIGLLDFLVLYLVKHICNVVEVGRWDNSSFWCLFFSVGSVSTKEDKLCYEDIYVTSWTLEVQLRLSFIDKGFAFGKGWYDCFFGIGYTCIVVVNYRNKEVEF